MIKVSIVIPVYNVGKYIEECLKSVIDQKCSAQIECILVDDCGKDNSVAIAAQFIEKYKGHISFKILHHEHNKGLSAARNTGTREAKGEYVYFLDSDDRFYNDESLSKLLSVADTYPDAEIVQGEMTGIGLSKEDIIVSYSRDRNWIRRGLCTIIIPDSACNRLVKRDFILTNNLFFVEGYYQEDTIWNYQVQKHISSIAFCYELTYWYRYNPEGIMNGMSKKKEAISFARVFNYTLDDMVKWDRIETYEIEYLIWNAKRAYGYIGKKEGIKLLKTQKNFLFNQAVLWSTSFRRIHNVKIRARISHLTRLLILNPLIKKLTNRKYLLYNYVDVNIG